MRVWLEILGEKHPAVAWVPVAQEPKRGGGSSSLVAAMLAEEELVTAA